VACDSDRQLRRFGKIVVLGINTTDLCWSGHWWELAELMLPVGLCIPSAGGGNCCTLGISGLYIGIMQ
jgi:hypothetical protein